MNHYIYSKANNINFKLNTDNWLFKYKEGWTDYFENIDINNNIIKNKKKDIIVKHGNVLYNYPLFEYKKIIPMIYKYNNTTKYKIYEKIKELNIIDKSFDSIFIRRGDKLFEESFLIPTEKYVDLLLEKNPLCTDLFIQTDDYNCFTEIKQIIETRKLNIRLYTLCPPTVKGVIVTERSSSILNIGNYSKHNNKKYLNEIRNELLKTKPVYLMTPVEKYDHTINMIIGIDIVLHSKICITDFQSNATRFIKLAHLNNSNVFSVLNPSREIDFNYCLCPAFPRHDIFW
jgi:hypothetical protein